MGIDDILIRHWIKNSQIKNLPGWKVDHTYKPKEGIMYLTNVKNSIHYFSIMNNDFTDYNLLISSTEQTEHSEQKFRELIDSFDLDFLEKNKIKINGNNIVIDGTHRMAVLLSKMPELNIIEDKWIEKK